MSCFAGCWARFRHLGGAPSESDAGQQAESVGSTYDFTKFDVKIHGGEGDEFAEAACSPVPAGCGCTTIAKAMPSKNAMASSHG